jgi:microcystin-dependent protein
MATRVSVQFGEVITDSSVHHAVALPAGVFEMGTPSISPLSGSGPWTVSLNPGGDRDLIVWREVGSEGQGRMTIQEDAPLTFTIAAANASNPRIDLLVGCHQWVDGSLIPGCMTSGQPNGTMDASMYPYYTVVQGTPAAGILAPTPMSTIGANGVPTPATSYSGPSGTGGAPVILAAVYVPAAGGAQPTIIPWTPTDARWATIYGYFQEIFNARGGQVDLNTRLSGIAAIPTGVLFPFAGGALPAGYLFCNGAAVPRVGATAALFAAIGTSYGVGDGSTTFNLPNMQGVFPLGASSFTAPTTGPYQLAQTAGSPGYVGEATHTLAPTEMPSHSHLIDGVWISGSGTVESNTGQYVQGPFPVTGNMTYNGIGLPDAAANVSRNTGGGTAHNNMPPYQTFNYIIKT